MKDILQNRHFIFAAMFMHECEVSLRHTPWKHKAVSFLQPHVFLVSPAPINLRSLLPLRVISLSYFLSCTQHVKQLLIPLDFSLVPWKLASCGFTVLAMW